MKDIKKYAIMAYQDTDEGTNIGDYIQSLAAAQYLPRIDYFINREELDLFDEDATKLIMNGWFTHNPEHWIPSKLIEPLFVAFHVNSSHKNQILTEKGIEYLRRHQPIGCRDTYTTDILKQLGIEAYYSGCLTLTLDKKYKVDDSRRSEDIYIVDPIFDIMDLKEHFSSFRKFLSAIKHNRFGESLRKRRLLKKMIDKSIRKNAIYIHHMIKPNTLSHEQKFEIAKARLSQYAKAKLVITSRIHCALPCLALGTPVIFINSFRDTSNLSRLKGLVNLFNHINLDVRTGEYTTNFPLPEGLITIDSVLPNPNGYQSLATELKKRCEEFIKQ